MHIFCRLKENCYICIQINSTVMTGPLDENTVKSIVSRLTLTDTDLYNILSQVEDTDQFDALDSSYYYNVICRSE